MEPLKTSNLVLTWMCMCMPNKKPNAAQRFLYVAFASIVHIANASALISCAAFFFKYVTIDLKQSLYALMNIAANFGVIYACVYVECFDRTNLNKIFKKLSKIYVACKYSKTT